MKIMSQIKTRLQVLTHLHHLVGPGRELHVAELPTVRDLIRYGLYLRESSDKDRRNYTTDELIADITTGLLAQWSKASPKFCEPVMNSHVRIRSKLKAVWEQATKVSSGRAKLDEKQRFMDKLDRMLDILTCKCDIKNCANAGCKSACASGVHVACKCSREKKIPMIELAFVKGQREKADGVGSHQIGAIDHTETRKQELQKEKQMKRIAVKEKQREKGERLAAEEKELMARSVLESEQEEVSGGDDSSDKEEGYGCSSSITTRKRTKYNTEDISHIAMASLRHHTGLRETAEIATAAWIDAGLITESDTGLVIDHNKVK